MDDEVRRGLQRRSNRIAGQISGIQRMIDGNRYCVDILNQIAAVRSALDALGIELLTNHLETCVLGHAGDTAHDQARNLSQDELLQEVRAALSRFLR